MNVYDRRRIGNASYTCTIASSWICDSSRTTARWYRQYLELLKIKGNARAITLHRNVMDFRAEQTIVRVVGEGYYHPCVNRLSIPILSGNRPLTEPREIQLRQPLSRSLVRPDCLEDHVQHLCGRRPGSRRSDRHLCRAISAVAAAR
jgi:hypothetical protein